MIGYYYYIVLGMKRAHLEVVIILYVKLTLNGTEIVVVGGGIPLMSGYTCYRNGSALMLPLVQFCNIL